MGLNKTWAELVARHAHVLLIEVPGHWLTRAAVERHILDRGWHLAQSPADADVLAVCGAPGPELSEVANRLWSQLPGPRIRVDVDSPDTARTALDAAEAGLRDSDRQQTDSLDRRADRGAEARHEDHPAEHRGAHGQHAEDRGNEPATHWVDLARPQDARRHGGGEQRTVTEQGRHAGEGQLDASAHPQHHGGAGQPRQGPGEQGGQVGGHGDNDAVGQAGHDAMGHGSHRPQHDDGRSTESDDDHHTPQRGHHGKGHGGGHDMAHDAVGGGEHTGHAGMGHGAMDMAPAGIPLASGAEDRDGLELDVLHARLGPVLAHWPSGLVLRCTLQGDVIVDAEARLIDAGPSAPNPRISSRHLFVARRCDNAAGLLALAGFDDAASHARRVRDAVLKAGGTAHASRQLYRLRRMVRRSWLLRWSLRRVGPLTERDLARWHLPEHLRGDVRDRLLSMLDRAAQGLAQADGQSTHDQPAVLIEAVADLVRGWDLAAARLIVASLDLEALTADREVSRV
ncbi:hypothetical protein [Micromonospora alfalfae]|uniref:hypothetical protein n=1 Tax=Micromonospora alfalfae TaxID=2911212 RepID=UPI003557D509